MYDSDMTEKDTILELYKKMTDKAHRTMKYILHSGNERFEAIKEKFLDHFHGDETTEKSLKKFKKANRKPGEKIYDFAIRLKELFRYAYPKNYEEDSFQIILKEKFIDGIDEKLQMKVKYKEFRTFDELVAATRKYSVRMEAIESNKERHEFVNAINQTSHPNNSEIQEIKQIVREQHETVNAIASALKQGNKQAEETATDQSEIANCVQELSKAVSFLLTKDGKQQHVQKQVTFQNQMPNFQPTYPNNGNSLRLPYKPFISNNTQPNQPFYNRPSWQPRPPRSQQWQPNQNAFQQPGFRPNFPTPFQIPNQPSTPTQQFTRFPLICSSCGVEGHVKNNCPVPRQQNFQPNFASNFQSNYQPNFQPNNQQNFQQSFSQNQQVEALESAKPPICYNCRGIGHKSFECQMKPMGPGAARSVMHYNLFQSLPQRSRGTCSKLDFDLYDVHDKKLNTFGQVILPIYYGDVRFFQNFVISDGISEDCILGWDAIREHGFTINGENQSIYLAREEPDQQKGTSGLAPEMTITASQRVKIPQQSVMVIEAKMKRSFPYVSPKATVVFTSNKTLPGTIEIASSIIGKVKIDYDSSLGDKTQVWLNCEDPEKGNMDNDNKLRDKTQVWLNCEDPDKVEIDNDSSLGDKTHDCLRQYYEDSESFKEPQGYSRRNIVAADFFCEPKDFSRRILTVSENIDEPEGYPRRSLVASESLKEPKVGLRRSFEATDFFCKPMEVAEDLKEPTFYNEVPKDLNSDLSLDLRSSDYLKQSKKIETENAIANEEKERSGKNPEVDSFEFPDVDLEFREPLSDLI
ncbi:hypothetical protein DAPPUDRAFT_120335 [Daphnia pulex]|uniref:CCHC-type domain-containing protein n=1 Tax=Daphnia pulex TaxID=6669 RepID=E9I107_DAPPU|nr:hypothetical protein DAPPUDRAFT_120335 [Daphnia pulex]|eukprot:EFX62323.1 hypothetical protein DAPPUDRAFT_120335 [Daphnia pulex]